MNRITVIFALAAVGIATPLAAQGRSGKQSRTYIDARGRECRETTQAKRNGDSKYEVKCKSAKHHKGAKHDDYDDDDDDDRDGRDGRDGRYSGNQQCIDKFGARRCDVVSSRSYPSTLPDMASAVIWGRGRRTMSAGREDAVRVFRNGRLLRVLGS
jgi:hypothetical protein